MLSEQMLPAKCSLKKALQKILPKTKCSSKKNAPPKKMLPFKMLPEKNALQSNSNVIDAPDLPKYPRQWI